MVAIFIISMILFFLTVDFFVQRRTYLAALRLGTRPRPEEAISPELVPIPAGLFLAPSHVWLQVAPSGMVRVGSDALAPAMLGHPERVELRAPGPVGRGEVLATLTRSGRSLSLRSPVDGVIEEVNEELLREPARLADAPYGESWLYRLRPKDLGAQLRAMRLGDEAVDWIRGEARRFRDSVADLARTPAAVGPTALDGGVPVACFATDLEDEAWEQLVQDFFDLPTSPATKAVSSN